MLVLSRHVGEEIVIGDGIVVTVVSVANGKVRLGVQAPRDVRVDRREVHDRRQEECPIGTPEAFGQAVSEAPTLPIA